MTPAERRRALDALDTAVTTLAALRAVLTADQTAPAPEIAEAEPVVEWLDVPAAAERFGRCQRQIRRLCRAGAGIRDGGRWLVDPAALREMLR